MRPQAIDRFKKTLRRFRKETSHSVLRATASRGRTRAAARLAGIGHGRTSPPDHRGATSRGRENPPGLGRNGNHGEATSPLAARLEAIGHGRTSRAALHETIDPGTSPPAARLKAIVAPGVENLATSGSRGPAAKAARAAARLEAIAPGTTQTRHAEARRIARRAEADGKTNRAARRAIASRGTESPAVRREAIGRGVPSRPAVRRAIENRGAASRAAPRAAIGRGARNLPTSHAEARQTATQAAVDASAATTSRLTMSEPAHLS